MAVRPWRFKSSLQHVSIQNTVWILNGGVAKSGYRVGLSSRRSRVRSPSLPKPSFYNSAFFISFWYASKPSILYALVQSFSSVLSNSPYSKMLHSVACFCCHIVNSVVV